MKPQGRHTRRFPDSQAKTERAEWANDINDQLRKMREAAAKGDAEGADRYGQNAHVICTMGPKNYIQKKRAHDENR